MPRARVVELFKTGNMSAHLRHNQHELHQMAPIACPSLSRDIWLMASANMRLPVMRCSVDLNPRNPPNFQAKKFLWLIFELSYRHSLPGESQPCLIKATDFKSLKVSWQIVNNWHDA
jgi:hypothetical protein